MKHVSRTSTGSDAGKYEKILMVLLAASLHALLIHLLVSSPLSTPAIPQAKPAITLELALAYAGEQTSDTAATVPAKATPPATETPLRDTSQSAANTLTTAPPESVAPPKPVKTHPEPRRTAKANPRTAPKQAPSPSTNTSSATETVAKTSSNQAMAATSPAPTGVVMPASANADHLNNPAPRYPALALKRKWQGTVTLRVHVLANGKPGEIQILNSSRYHMLDQAAIAAVRQWTFVPAQRDGMPQDSWASFPLSFKLQ